MERSTMRISQGSGDASWALPARASRSLRVGPGPRVLLVDEGRLWITTSGTADVAALDVWLAAGESVELPDRLDVVMEAWPSARYRLLVPPSACRRDAAGGLAQRLARQGVRLLRSRRRIAGPGLSAAT